MNVAEKVLPAVGVSVMILAVVAVGYSVGVNASRKPALRWDAISIANEPSLASQDKLIVNTRATRRPIGSSCANGFQSDIRAGDVVKRTPVPARTMTDDGSAKYDVVLPDDVRPGLYEIRIREVFNCSGRTETIEAPWTAFRVLP